MSERLKRSGILKPFVFALTVILVLGTLGFRQVNADDLNPDEIDLYYLDDKVKAAIGNLPSGYKSTYTINTTGLSGTPTYKVTSGDSYATVSSDGIISIVKPLSTDYVTGHYSKVAEVKVTCGDYSKNIKVNIKDYAAVYADQKTDTVLKSIIKSGMTDLQKLTAITKWVAQNTEYSFNNTSYEGMMVYMGGDCWASSFTIVAMCEKVGIKAIDRNANRDYDQAGAGHRNVIALCDGKYYVAEAGYYDEKPRAYDVTERPGGFSIKGSTLYQYDGFETDVTVPGKIGKTTITQFGDGKYGVMFTDDVTSIKLPSTIKTIAPQAFSYSQTAKVTVDSSNQYFTVSNDVLYSKDKSKLIYAPINISELKIDKSTTEITAYSLAELELKKVVIPGNVKTIGQNAFERSEMQELVLEEGVTTIGAGAFDSCYDLTVLTIPSTVTSVGDDAFNTHGRIKQIYFGGTEAQWTKISSEFPSDADVFFNSVRVSGIELNGDGNITMTAKDQAVELGATVVPSNATNKDIVYTTSNKNVAKIEGNKLTAVSEGSCTVTATTSDGGFTATYNVTVAYPRYKLTIEGGYTFKGGSTERTEYEFLEGESVYIYNKAPSNKVTFKQWQIDEDVVINSGSLTSNSFGVKLPARDVTIKAIYAPVLVTFIDVYYSGEVSGFYLCPEMSIKLSVTYYPSNAYDPSVVWSSKNEAVATVDSEGNVTAVAPGDCDIIGTAADGSGKIDTYTITVKDHTWNDGTVTKEATCTEDGTKVLTCTHEGCGKSKTVTIKALGHNLTEVPAKAATKTEPGNINYYKCSRCGKLFTDAEGKQEIAESAVVIPATGHVLTKVAANSPTCTEPGNIEYYVCKDTDCGCGKYYSDENGQNEISMASTVVPAAGHNMIATAKKEPTCTNDGHEAYFKCKTCGKLFSDKDGINEITAPVAIEKLGHSWDSGKVTKSPGCETSGIMTYKCTRDKCVTSKTEKIDPLGHDPEHKAAKEATYDDVGWKEHYECKRCGKKFSDSACKNPVTDDEILIPCKKHTLTKIPAKAPSCTEAGYKEHYKCKDEDCGCGKLFSDKFGQNEISASDIAVPPTGHSLTEVTAKDPTCTAPGNIKHWICTGCGKLYSDEQGKDEIDKSAVVVPASGHDKEHLEHHAYKAPTRDNDGHKEYFICPGCGKKFTDADCTKEISDVDIVIPAIGAAKLGEEAEAGDFRYKVTYAATDGTGTVTLIGVVNPSASVAIPSTVEIKESTYIVNRIGPKAFYNDKTIKTLAIGPNVTIIDNYAFYGCSYLVKVSGGEKLKIIGSYAFALCTRLKTFVISSKVLTKIGAYSFKKDSALKTIYIRNTVSLTKAGVKKSLKGSKVKKVKVKKSKVKKYKKYFSKKNCGRKVKVKK